MNKLFFLCIFVFLSLLVKGQIAYSKAEALASETISAMGGKNAFDQTEYIGWNFFGYRKLIWDKKNNRIRVDYLKKDLTIITYLHKDEGYLYMNGIQITKPDSLTKYFSKARKVWMNDSYWLVMPFKLFDSGVHLKYVGSDTSLLQTYCDVLEMTFEKVGATPENKYQIFINKESKLIDTWKYFANYSDTTPEIINAWSDYKMYGNILLSSNRGSEGILDELFVWTTLPEYIFIDQKIPPFQMLGK